MECDHKSKVLDWAYELKDGQMNQYVSLYGCTECDATSPAPFPDKEEIYKIDHSNCHLNPCFGCKAKGLQLSTGDANGRASMPRRKWEGELQAYRDARRQGIQPAGTTMSKIVAAEKASENLGRAYNAEKDPNARHIDKKTAKTINELGA
jgi:hypothetical protein